MFLSLKSRGYRHLQQLVQQPAQAAFGPKEYASVVRACIGGYWP